MPNIRGSQRRWTHSSVSATAHFIPTLQASSPHTSRHSQRIVCSPTMHHSYITRSLHTQAGLYKVPGSSSFNRYTKLFCCLNFHRYAKLSSYLYQDIRSSVMLRSVAWQVATDVSGQPESPITTSH